MVSLSFGHPLNLILYIPFKMLSCSSNILKTNFDLMDSIPVSGTLEYSKRVLRFSDHDPATKLFGFTSQSCGPSVLFNVDFLAPHSFSIQFQNRNDSHECPSSEGDRRKKVTTRSDCLHDPCSEHPGPLDRLYDDSIIFCESFFLHEGLVIFRF